MDVNIGKGITLDVSWEDLPQNALEHVIYIGLRNILMDAHASITKDEYPDPDHLMATAEALAERKLSALMKGEVRVAGTRSRVDQVMAEAIRLATAMVKKGLQKAGKRLADYKPAELRAAAEKLVAKNPSLVTQAEANIAALAELDAEIEI